MRYLALLILLVGCAPRLQSVNPAELPDPMAWGPNQAAVEWWYVSAALPEEGLAFHWALFKAYTPPGYQLGGVPANLVFPGPYYAAHLAITDLNSHKLVFEEYSDFPQGGSQASFPPLNLKFDANSEDRIPAWTLIQTGENFILKAGPLDLVLTPKKNPVVHPPGYSGNEVLGRLYYQSYTRLGLEGSISGRAVQGEAWMDHQWGEQYAGTNARWDWLGIHLNNHSELMLYRIRNAKGEVVQLVGSWIDQAGKAHMVENLRMTPQEVWVSPTKRSYNVAWRVEADDLSLDIKPLRLEQELLSQTTRVAYWEGPVQVEGIQGGFSVKGQGMEEIVAGGVK